MVAYVEPVIGVLPPLKETWPFVAEHNRQRYLDLKRASKVIKQAVVLSEDQLLAPQSLEDTAKDMYQVFSTQQFFNRVQVRVSIILSNISLNQTHLARRCGYRPPNGNCQSLCVHLRLGSGRLLVLRRLSQIFSS